jgi:maltose O-acetyltransferase
VFSSNFNCIVLDVCRVRIATIRSLAPRSNLHAHAPVQRRTRRREEFGKPIDIGADVWVEAARSSSAV